MGRESKAVQLTRRQELADVMRLGKGYQHEWTWYSNKYGNSEKTFQADKTAIYAAWKIEYSKDIEEHKINLLNKLRDARDRAIDGYDVKAEIMAIKLEAEILGILNKKGEAAISSLQQNVINVNLSVEEIKEILYGNHAKQLE